MQSSDVRFKCPECNHEYLGVVNTFTVTKMQILNTADSEVWQLHNKCLRQLETAVNSGIMYKILNPKSESVNNFSLMIDGDTYTYAYSSQLGELSILDPNGKLSYSYLSKSDKEVASLNLGELNEDISSL